MSDVSAWPPLAVQQELRALAEAAARCGGAIALQFFRRPLQVRFKADRSEVSEADETAQAAIVAQLRAARPADSFVAEETLHGGAPRSDGVCWVIDPIDGTRNFVRGLPHFACSIGALYNGTPVAGAILDVPRGTLYSASVAEGFFVDGQVRPPLARVPDRHPRLVVGIPSAPAGPIAPLAHRWLDRFICRNFGSTALHLALVATGELDGMLADNPRLWDIAAGCLLVEAAGGRCRSPEDRPLFPCDVATYRGGELPLVAGVAWGFGQLLPPDK
jgi:myo-inositol-1(or 4)-monophosphatase